MKPIASPWRSTRSIGSRGCKRSERMPRRNSVTNKSNAGPTHTRTASMLRKLPDGGGRTGQNNERTQRVAETKRARPSTGYFQADTTERRFERIFHECSNASHPYSGEAEHGPNQYQHHPHVVHGWSAGSKFGTSRNSHGDGAGSLYSLAGVPSLRSAGSRVAEPRSLRAVHWPCVHVALFPAPLDRSPSRQQGLRNSRRVVGAARCHQGVPATG